MLGEQLRKALERHGETLHTVGDRNLNSIVIVTEDTCRCENCNSVYDLKIVLMRKKGFEDFCCKLCKTRKKDINGNTW